MRIAYHKHNWILKNLAAGYALAEIRKDESGEEHEDYDFVISVKIP